MHLTHSRIASVLIILLYFCCNGVVEGDFDDYPQSDSEPDSKPSGNTTESKASGETSEDDATGKGKKPNKERSESEVAEGDGSGGDKGECPEHAFSLKQIFTKVPNRRRKYPKPEKPYIYCSDCVGTTDDLLCSNKWCVYDRYTTAECISMGYSEPGSSELLGTRTCVLFPRKFKSACEMLRQCLKDGSKIVACHDCNTSGCNAKLLPIKRVKSAQDSSGGTIHVGLENFVCLCFVLFLVFVLRA